MTATATAPTPASNVIDLFAAFATDNKLEQDGVETELPGCGDVKFIVAREGNSSYSKLLQKQVKQNRAVLDSKGTSAEAKSNEIMADVMSKTILLGWDRPLMFKGEMLSYSIPNARKLLELKEFRAVVSSVSADLEKFKVVKDEEEGKS